MRDFDFDKSHYALRDPIKPVDVARFQNEIMEFMELVKSDKDNTVLRWPQKNQKLVERFCTFINDEKLWHFVADVLPELREHGIAEANALFQGNRACLDHIIETVKDRIQPGANRRNPTYGDREDELMTGNFRKTVEYLELYGKKGMEDDPDVLKRIDEVVEQWKFAKGRSSQTESSANEDDAAGTH